MAESGRKINTLVTLAAILLGSGVAMGAFGSHALRDLVPPNRLETWDTAVLYQLIHGLGLLILALLSNRSDSPPLKLSTLSLTLGTCFFSGSLYALVAFDLPVLGALTPIGGALFLIGWANLAWQYGRHA